MYAIIKTGGKQYVAEPGADLKIEKVSGKVGDPITFEKILMTSDSEHTSVGTPYLENVQVLGRITRQDKERKVIVFKYKRRKDYRKKTGHRQEYTQVSIEGINVGG